MKIPWFKKIFLPFIICLPFISFAQYTPNIFLRRTVDTVRAKAHQRIINYNIKEAFSRPLTEETEEDWKNAFTSMEIIQYTDLFTDLKMRAALGDFPSRSASFQKAVLEAVSSLYIGTYDAELMEIMKTTSRSEIFAAAGVNLFRSDVNHEKFILEQIGYLFLDGLDQYPQIKRLKEWMKENQKEFEPDKSQILKALFSKDFLPGKTVMFSLQRHNRLYPGLVVIRDESGHFFEEDGRIFSVPQLARAVSNLPYFIKMGNTPQGIFSMYGLGVSTSPPIGPTANIQMGMPVELSVGKFFHDKRNNADSWNKKIYGQLLPAALRNYEPLYETYYAGELGRNEIIAHGSTVNPDYYLGQPFYPLTPTDGCLSTKEIWNGRLEKSDQVKLVNALIRAGGANGFVVVVDIDNGNRPVTIGEIEKYIPTGK